MRLCSEGCLLALVLRGFADPMRSLAANCIGLYDGRMHHQLDDCDFRDHPSLTIHPIQSLWLLSNTKKERIDCKGLLDACELIRQAGTCTWQDVQRT